MSMTKQDFIVLADAIREHNADNAKLTGLLIQKQFPPFELAHINTLMEFCEKQNPHFDSHKWTEYLMRK